MAAGDPSDLCVFVCMFVCVCLCVFVCVFVCELCAGQREEGGRRE